jgi:NitT/TauT family transport system substrate-binding protein
MQHNAHRRRTAFALLGAVTLGLLAACGSDDGASASTAAPDTTAAAPDTTAAAPDPTAAAPDTTSGEKVTLRLGYFPNITHATALVGVGKGIFADAFGPNVKLETQTFTVGTKAVEALFADAIDASYVGPNPAINAYSQSKGTAVRIISGATSGGAFLVVKPAINGPADLKGKKVASPGLGGTQDVALRSWLLANGLKTDTAGGGDVSVVPQENAQTLEAFVAGTIDGAWVPEPWASRLAQEGGGKVLVDERTLWPEGEYVTTHLMVATKFLDKHPDVVKRLLEGQVKANAFVNANPAEAQQIANTEIEKITTKKLKDGLIQAAWPNLEFTDDPIASSLSKSAADAQALGLLKPVDNLPGIYDLTLLNEVLKADGQPAVSGL